MCFFIDLDAKFHALKLSFECFLRKIIREVGNIKVQSPLCIYCVHRKAISSKRQQQNGRMKQYIFYNPTSILLIINILCSNKRLINADKTIINYSYYIKTIDT